MLRQNGELRPHRIWNWTLPAWYVVRPDGSRFMTCPSAGVCAQFCYARTGAYRFSNVLRAHVANLDRVLADVDVWVSDMVLELRARKFRPTGVPRVLPIELERIDPGLHEWVLGGGAAVRVHDSGDFFSEQYLRAWCRVASLVPDVLFYAYTKEVSLVRAVGELPANFRVLFSTGGLEDHLIDPDTDRHADVFPSLEAMVDAGYESQDANDLLAVLLPTTRIGITANNIRHVNKRLAGRRFSDAVPVRLRMPARDVTDVT